MVSNCMGLGVNNETLPSELVGEHEGGNHSASCPGSKVLPKQLDFTRWRI